MSARMVDGRNMGPKVFNDVEVRLGSGKTLQSSRLYLFEKSSFLQLYRFGEPWLGLLPWPTPRQHRRIVGYLQARQDWEPPASSSSSLELDIAEITATRGSFTRKLTDIAIVRTNLDSTGKLYVKFIAAQSQQSIAKDEPGTQDEDICEF